MRLTRLLIISAVAAISSGDALAGSLDESILRGSTSDAYYVDQTSGPVRPRFVPGTPVSFSWRGLYLGAQGGYSNAGADFGSGTSDLIGYILRNDVVLNHVQSWTTLGKGNTDKLSYGGFAGYNFQAGQIVYGFEGNYNRVAIDGLQLGSIDSMTRTFQDDSVAPAGHHFFYTASVSSAATARLTDYGTIRARGGFVLDRFLPYGFIGAAIGSVDTNRSATVSYTREDIPDVTVPPAPAITPLATYFFGPQTQGERRNGVIAYGYSAGLGVDVAILPNVFMRGEWEYIQFIPVQSVRLNLNSVRAGIGVKF
jgi:outer membrane immunogenic protein